MPQRPDSSEYSPAAATYIALVPEDDILAALAAQIEDFRRLGTVTTPEQEMHRYAPKKWTVREVVGHIGDAERVFGYRAFTFSRGAETPLPGFDENAFVAASGFNRRSLASLCQELVALRESNLAMLHGLDGEAWLRRGTANNRSVSVRALAYLMVGHARHHLAILRERYGVA